MNKHDTASHDHASVLAFRSVLRYLDVISLRVLLKSVMAGNVHAASEDMQK